MSFWKTVRPAPLKPFSRAIQHEANYYRPFFDAGQILKRRVQHVARGEQPPAPRRTARPLHISQQDGWRYAFAAAAIVGVCSYLAIHGDLGALTLAPVALVPGTLAYAGLRRPKR